MTANIGRKWLTKGLPGDQALGAHLDSKIVCKFHQIHKRIIKIPGDGFCLLLICTSLARSNSPSYLQLLQQQWYPLPTTMERAPLNTTVPCWQPLYKHHQWQYSGIGSHGYLMPSLATMCWALKKKKRFWWEGRRRKEGENYYRIAIATDNTKCHPFNHHPLLLSHCSIVLLSSPWQGSGAHWIKN